MEHVLLHAKMDIIAYFGGSTGVKYVYLPPVFPLGNRENTLIKNPKLRDICMYVPVLLYMYVLVLTSTVTPIP